MTYRNFMDQDSSIEGHSSSRVDHSSDSHQISKILTGDSEAFADLVRAYLPLFTAGIHRVLQNMQDTQEALQEALLNIHADLCSLGNRKFSIWAYRICINEALALRHSRMRQPEINNEAISMLSREGHQTLRKEPELWAHDLLHSETKDLKMTRKSERFDN